MNKSELVKIIEQVIRINEKTKILGWNFLDSLEEYLYDYESELDWFVSKEKDRQNKRNKTLLWKRSHKEFLNAWGLTNLQPGMIVKVTSNSRTKYRYVTEVNATKFKGHHINLSPRGKDGIVRVLDRDYITDHMFDKVQTVLCVNNIPSVGSKVFNCNEAEIDFISPKKLA